MNKTVRLHSDAFFHIALISLLLFLWLDTDVVHARAYSYVQDQVTSGCLAMLHCQIYFDKTAGTKL